MTRLRSPIQWFGGKGRMISKLLPLLPRCHTWVEVFGGGASLTMARQPSPVEVYNDLDGDLCAFFRVLADEELFARFYRRVGLLPYAREIYNEYRASWRECDDPVERAARWFVVARQSFSGIFALSWGTMVTASCRGMSASCSCWLSCLEMLPEIHARLLRVQIENSDFRVILDRYDTPDTLFYCDPPYVQSTRRDGGYTCEMSDADHRELVELLLTRRGMCVLSGYASELYLPLEDAGWLRMDFQTVCHAAGRTRNSNLQGEGAALAMQSRTESVWRNPAAMIAQGRLDFNP